MAKTDKPGASGARGRVTAEGVGAIRNANAVFMEGRNSFIRPPISVRTLEVEFEELAARWREDTEHLSSTSVFAHPAYQRIIGLGAPVVPILLRDLIQTETHWFWALRAITGENPVPAEDAGNVRKMIDA